MRRSIVSLHVAVLLLMAALVAGCSTNTSKRTARDARKDSSRTAAGTAEEITTASGPILWQADFETGDLSQWELGNNQGAMEEVDSGSCSRPAKGVSTEQAHSGEYSMKMVINSRSTAGCRQFRKAETATGAPLYYSAWFYFPERVQVGTNWNLFQFKAKVDKKTDLFWKLDVRNNDAGDMEVILVWKSTFPGPHEGNGRQTRRYTQSQAVLPVGEWVHLEVFLRQSGQFDGQIIVWQDGIELFNIDNVRTKPPRGVQNWSVNNYGHNLSPNPTTLYIDDVVISTERIGP